MLLVASCKETTSSEFIRTGRIAALMSATAESEDSSTVRVELRVGSATGQTFVVLGAGDELSATAGDQVKLLHAVSEGVYEGTFATGHDVELTVDLDRASDVDAPASKAVLPAPFTFEGPQPGDELSRAKDVLLIAWTPVPDSEGTIELEGPCIVTASYEVSGAAGMWKLDEGEIVSVDEEIPEVCVVEIEARFQREGAADPAFDDDSYFIAHQTRKVVFTSMP